MTNSASVTFRLPPELKARVDSLAKKTRRSPSSFYCQMVEEGIDGLEDLYDCIAVMDDVKSGRMKTYSLESVAKELDYEG